MPAHAPSCRMSSRMPTHQSPPWPYSRTAFSFSFCQGSTVTLAKNLQAGAKGKIEVGAHTKTGLRKQASDKTLSTEGEREMLERSSSTKLPPAQPGFEGLQDALGRRLREMLSLFTEYDQDGSGTIDKPEFRRAVAALGLEYEDEIVDAVFDGYDADGSGEMEYKEFVQYSLRDSLKRSAGRVMTLFRQWDRDGSGSVDKKEFRKAMKELGFDAPTELIDSIFDDMDKDHGGSVDFKELNKVLRQGASVVLSKKLQTGSVGFDKKAEQKHGLRGSSAKQLPVSADGSSPRAETASSKLPPPAPGLEGLQDALGRRLREMLNLFKEYDVDGNGTIDKSEFRRAVAAIGLEYEDEIVDIVFDSYDADGSGEMEYKEFVQYSLRDSLKRSAGRVMTLFRQWDRDGSGSVDKKEFRRAMKELGFDAPTELLDSVFDSMDKDHGGSVDFKELNKVLRQGASVELDSSLQVGAAGRIEVKAEQKHGLRKEASRGKIS